MHFLSMPRRDAPDRLVVLRQLYQVLLKVFMIRMKFIYWWFEYCGCPYGTSSGYVAGPPDRSDQVASLFVRQLTSVVVCSMRSFV